MSRLKVEDVGKAVSILQKNGEKYTVLQNWLCNLVDRNLEETLELINKSIFVIPENWKALVEEILLFSIYRYEKRQIVAKLFSQLQSSYPFLGQKICKYISKAFIRNDYDGLTAVYKFLRLVYINKGINLECLSRYLSTRRNVTPVSNYFPELVKDFDPDTFDEDEFNYQLFYGKKGSIENAVLTDNVELLKQITIGKEINWNSITDHRFDSPSIGPNSYFSMALIHNAKDCLKFMFLNEKFSQNILDSMLTASIYGGDIKMILFIFEQTKKLSDGSPTTALQDAIVSSRRDVIEWIFSLNDEEFQYTGGRNKGAYFAAGMMNNYWVLEQFLKRPTGIEDIDSVLCAAAQFDHLNMIVSFHEIGHRLKKIRTDVENYIIEPAVHSGFYGVTKKLLELGVPPRFPHYKYGPEYDSPAPLHDAAIEGDLRILDLLATWPGSDVNILDTRGYNLYNYVNMISTDALEYILSMPILIDDTLPTENYANAYEELFVGAFNERSSRMEKFMIFKRNPRTTKHITMDLLNSLIPEALEDIEKYNNFNKLYFLVSNVETDFENVEKPVAIHSMEDLQNIYKESKWKIFSQYDDRIVFYKIS